MNNIIQENNLALAQKVVESLLKKNMTLATAESCTGGQISAMLTAIPGCSAVFPGGVCTYSEQMKMQLLGVEAETLNKCGVVSCETALAMAKGVQTLTKSDLAVATTGIAGPTGGTEKQPVGTVCFAVVSRDREEAWCENFADTEDTPRLEIQQRAVYAALKAIQMTVD